MSNEKNKYSIGGFAPGSYMCTCCVCKQQFIGDKRAVECESCALNARKLPSTILEAECLRWEWSQKTFTQATSISSLIKCKEEIKEIESDILANIKEPLEYADAIMCLFDSAARNGISKEQIEQAYIEKVIINLNRKWVKNQDNTYSHIKL